ncbi:uncharacterized protein LOC112184442 [Rosa chinensis]|uniref:uncharacterized protein LOC112184442 n=1 Tax=Rosa chinensis TaxID=74649 RepID=UPI000D08E711|nr:uncharacterized protein LOC112184442 [Rosa chinensis]
MEDMRKRPGADVTTDDASSSSSAKRRRDQAEGGGGISVAPPVANDVVVADRGDVSVTPAVNDVVADNGDILAPPAVNGVVADSGDASVPPAANDVVVENSDISVPPAMNGVVAVPPAVNDVVAVPPAVNDVVAVPPAVNDVVAESGDETASELSRLLETDYLSRNSVAAPARLTFSEHPSRSPKLFQTMSTSYITINGNEESCGSSFSDAESSVMASVDRTGRDVEQVRLDYEWYAAERWAEGHGESGFDDRAWDAADQSARERMVLNLDLNSEWDDAALARFVGEDLN